MKMTKQEYAAYVQSLSPKSPTLKNCCFAFCIGGLLCVIGQLITNGYGKLGLDKEAAGCATSISMVFLGAALTALNWYDDIAKYAGAGTLVPITGFANAVVSPAMEFRSEGLVTGMAAKMFTIAGPVIVYGLSASVLYGFFYWLWTILG